MSYEFTVKKFIRGKIAAIDIDDTLLNDDVRQDDGYGKLNSGALDAIKELRSKGYKILIHSTRLNPAISGQDVQRLRNQAEDALRRRGVQFDEVWIGNGKPFFDVVIDDRAVHFDGDWKKAVVEAIKLGEHPGSG